MEKIQKIKFLIFFVLVGVFFSISAAAAQAASLYFSPSSGSHTVGKTFSVGVYVSSADQAINAASGVISFPNDKLEVASLSKTGSIFNLWVQEPSFSNALGTVNFEGIILNPGFTGSAGKIITINFKTKTIGDALVSFSSGSILANDGYGTNILKALGQATFKLIVEKVPEAPPAVAEAPSAPVIFSSTHPDQEKWYASNNPKFEWSLSKDIDGVNVLADKNPTTNPGTISDGLFSSYTYENVADGVWYFHIRLKNAQGWGKISHFKFQIDTKPPEPFFINFIDGKETENPKPTIAFETTDDLSGIDYYKIKIGEFEEIVTKSPYTLPFQTPGRYNIQIQAIDKAGNYTTTTDEFIIKPPESPEITEYPQKLPSGEILVIKGWTKYPNAQVIIWRQRENEEAVSQTVKSDKDGNFTFIADEKLKDGIYKLWAEVVDERGARSEPTEKVTITVEQPKILKIVIVLLVALIILLLVLIWYGWHRFSLFRKKIRKETKETKEALHQAFKALKEKTKEQLTKLDGKPDLSEREKKICNNLKKALKISEEFIGKEIEDIEKEIKKQ